MTFALLEHDPRYDLAAVKALSDVKFGHDALRWVDAPPGTSVGDVLRPDGSIGPHVPPLPDAQALKLREIKADCATAIRGGFTSSALGAPHRYGSSDTDQTNVDRAAMASLTGQKDPNWTAQIPCAPADAPADAAMVFTAHTAGQVHQVSSDLHVWIEGCRLKRDALNAEVAAATATATALAITWA